MRICVELEMLAVLLLLTPIVTDGLVMKKCQLKEKLEEIIPENETDRENKITKIVCHAEASSNCDTSLVNPIPLQSFSGIRKTRNAPKKGTKLPPKPATKPALNPLAKPALNPLAKPALNPLAKPALKPLAKPALKPLAKPALKPLAKPTIKPLAKPTIKLTKTLDPSLNSKSLDVSPEQPHNYQIEPEMTPNNNLSNTENETAPSPPPPVPKSDTTSRDERDVSEQGMLYGLFQLSDRVACVSPSKPSFNICNLNCDKLIDEDLTDDINCVLSIVNAEVTNPDGGDEANMLIGTVRSELINACPNMVYTQYFAACNNP